jgi:anhydro-N-acetylmuramic acid kinase
MSGTSVDGIDVACVDLELDGDELGCGYRGVLSVPFDATLLARLKAEPYFLLLPPRSTGRELFNAGYLRAMLAGIDPVPARPDVAATVTRLLVDLLAEAAKQHGLSELVGMPPRYLRLR